MKRVIKNKNNKRVVKRLMFNIMFLFIVLSICGIFLNFNLAKKDIKTSEVVIKKEDTSYMKQ